MSDMVTVRPASTTLRPRRDPVRLKTNDLYRIPEPWDLKPGLELIMVEAERDNVDPAIIGTRIRIDNVKKSLFFPGLVVFYHCIRPSWEGQCFTAAENIVRLPTGRPGPMFDPHKYLYWLPREFEPQV